MKQIVFTCDVCGRQKQESNHWFTVQIRPGIFFDVRYWARGDALQENILHICGEECLHKKLNEFLQSRSTVTVTKEA